MKTEQYGDSIANFYENEWDTILEGAEDHLGSDAGKVDRGEGDDDDDDDDNFLVFVSDDERAMI